MKVYGDSMNNIRMQRLFETLQAENKTLREIIDEQDMALVELGQMVAENAIESEELQEAVIELADIIGG